MYPYPFIKFFVSLFLLLIFPHLIDSLFSMSEAEGILSDLSEEELDLTVEEFLNKKCDKSIKEVEAAAEEMVKEIQNEHKQRVEEIKKKIRE
jgi:hypothetical protein